MENLNSQGPKADEIKGLFSRIAHGYDRANDLMTFGRARAWRRRLVKLSGASHGDSVLDCATGTGDLAFDFKRVVGPQGKVIGTDFCEDMLRSAPAKADQLGLEVEFAVADAMDLPYPDSTFNVTSISYGIRNVEKPAVALKEMARVTRPGGRVMILETGELRSPLFGRMVSFYFDSVVPRIGGWVSGDRKAYEYLNVSSAQFMCREDFVRFAMQTGCFERVEYESIMGGASFIYTCHVQTADS